MIDDPLNHVISCMQCVQLDGTRYLNLSVERLPYSGQAIMLLEYNISKIMNVTVKAYIDVSVFLDGYDIIMRDIDYGLEHGQSVSFFIDDTNQIIMVPYSKIEVVKRILSDFRFFLLFQRL